MTDPYWRSDDGAITLYHRDCREVLAELPPESVSACVTSPPFWGLRSYECEPVLWGGDPDCAHRLGPAPASDAEGVSRQEPPEAWVKHETAYHKGQVPQTKWRTNTSVAAAGSEHQGATCSLCGAWRGHYGQEPSVSMYVEHTMEWLRAVKRVLRKDGVVFLDIDDSRNSTSPGNKDVSPTSALAGAQTSQKYRETLREYKRQLDRRPVSVGEIRAKSLCLIPQRLAIAAADEGWTVRSQIVIAAWMPESARDRPTDAYRTLLMLRKSKRYWSDFYAVRVAASSKFEAARWNRQTYVEERGSVGVFTHGDTHRGSPDGLRYLGNLWTDISPTAHPSSPSFKHFAVMPLQEAQRAILASVPEAICTKCGKPRVRIVSKVTTQHDGETASGYEDGMTAKRLALLRQAARRDGQEYVQDSQTAGWTACDCDPPEYEPGTVLDPFAGTGTTLVAAQKLGRKAIGIELSGDYCRQAVTRLTVGDRGIRRLAAAENDRAADPPRPLRRRRRSGDGIPQGWLPRRGCGLETPAALPVRIHLG